MARIKSCVAPGQQVVGTRQIIGRQRKTGQERREREREGGARVYTNRLRVFLLHSGIRIVENEFHGRIEVIVVLQYSSARV